MIDYITDQDNVLETRAYDAGLTTEFQDTGLLQVGVEGNFERLDEPFFIRPGQPIPAGDYQFDEFFASYSSDKSRMFSGKLSGATGSFWDGDRSTYTVEFRFQANYQFRADVAWTHNDIDLPSGAFKTDLVTSRLSYSFSTDVFLNALIQYNSTLREISSNIRFNYIYKPLSDFFLVYNERRSSTGEVRERALIAKLTYLFDF